MMQTRSLSLVLASSRRALSSGQHFGSAMAVLAGEELLIKGQATFDVENPATGEHICKVEAADAKLTDYAIDIAHGTYLSGEWSKADVRHGAKVLQQISVDLRARIDELAERSGADWQICA